MSSTAKAYIVFAASIIIVLFAAQGCGGRAGAGVGNARRRA